MTDQERWGYAIHTKDQEVIVCWLPPAATKILVYGRDADESLPVAYSIGNEVVRVGEADSSNKGAPNSDLERICHNKYKIDLISRAIRKWRPT